jgi:hypothetical protein
MKLFCQITRPLIDLNLKVRSKRWSEAYYIYRDEEKLMDSMGNLFHYSWEDFIRLHQEVLNNAGPIWEIYEEVEFDNL